MTDTASSDILIGPRTTVFMLLDAYPFLESFLLVHDRDLESPTLLRAHLRRARVTTLSDVAVGRNIAWSQLAGEIAARVTAATGRPARLATASREVAGDDHRLRELRAIFAALEGGGSLLELAARWTAVSGGLEPEEVAALDVALSVAAGAAVRDGDRPLLSPPPGSIAAAAIPEGHPLGTLRREAVQIRLLSTGLQSALSRLGGSPTRRRWCRERPLVARLVERLGGIEQRFRRLQQAWFPALAVHGISGPQALLGEMQADTLETLRRLRLAVANDDAASVAESGTRLVESLDDLLAQDEGLVEPPAQRYFSPGDWAALRELEDGVEWLLIAPPPPWPPV